MSTNIGIDYGLGRSNVDKLTGIRYGVISQHTVGQAWYDSAEADYGEPHCPKCGNEATTIPSHTEARDPPGQWVRVIQNVPQSYESFEDDGNEYACESCKYLFDGDEAFGDEPQSWSVDDGDYKLTDCLDSDIFVLASPFYTYAQFCSPCVPGAGNLDNPCEPDSGAPKCYCLGHDWFEDGKAPYRLWNVTDDSEVTAAQPATATEGSV